MLTLEMAIQKIQQFSPEQRNQVIQLVEFLDFKSSQMEPIDPQTHKPEPEQEFFDLAGLWKNKKIITKSIRSRAWGEE
jgi:hypothetical protein